jgi:hypothetical protein
VETKKTTKRMDDGSVNCRNRVESSSTLLLLDQSSSSLLDQLSASFDHSEAVSSPNSYANMLKTNNKKKRLPSSS